MSSSVSSIGIASLDTVIGGFPDASLYLLEEDEHALYSSLLVRTLLSSLLHSNTPCHYLTQRKYNVHALPSRSELKTAVSKFDIEQAGDRTGIAWRYGSMAPIGNSLSGNNVTYDFGSPLSTERIDKNGLSPELITKVNIDQIDSILSSCPKSKRIIIEGLTDAKCQISADQIPLLLYKLKSLTRTNPTVSVFVTLSGSQLSESSLQVIRGICDCCLEMKSFDRPNMNYPDFDGLLLVHKLATINIVRSHKSLHTLDLGFQMKSGRYLTVDTLTLPPDIEDRSTACKPSLPKLEF